MKEALKLALEALEHFRDTGTRPSDLAMSEDAIAAIKEALREHAMYEVQRLGQEIQPEPPQRTWQGLTDEEIILIVADCASSHQHTDIHFARAIEAKLKEKNT